MSKKTLEQLQEEHSQMCATAGDLGLEVPADLTVDFDTVEIGKTVVSNLDALIRKHKAGLDEKDLQAGVAQVTETEQTDDGETNVASTEPTEEDEVAKQAVKKAASPKPKKASKTTAKAAPKKAAKGNGVAKANGVASRGFDENAKINWTAKTNPAREGSGRHERIEMVRKSSGRTVKNFLANKGNPTTLRNCVNAKLCTVA